MTRIVLLSAVALIAAAVLGAGGYAGLWFANAQGAEAAVAQWADRTRAAGYTVQIGAVEVSGFPTAVDLELTDVTVGQPDGALPWEWRVDVIRGASGGAGVSLRIVGEQTLTYTAGGEAHTLRAAAQRFRIEAGETDDGGRGVYVDVRGLILDRPAGLGRVTAERFELRAALGDGPGAIPDRTEALVSLQNLVLPEHRRGPLGDTISVLKSELVFIGVLESLDLPVSLADWRDGEGLIGLRDLSVSWGTLQMEVRSGALTLDDAFRPVSGFYANVSGYAITVDAFHAAGRLTDDDMAVIRGANTFMRQQGRGGGGAIGLPVVIEDGNVTVGQATLGAVPRLLPGLAPG